MQTLPSTVASLFSSLRWGLRWGLLAIVVGFAAGSASALFLVALDIATTTRENHLWLLALMPLAGALIGWVYSRFGASANRGNNLLLDEFHRPTRGVPLRMFPLVLGATLLTHLVGGSAGREGTAVQMGGSLADQLTHILKLRPRDRRLLIATGVAAGFASVFGTPLAGMVFALEVMSIGIVRFEALLPALVGAFVADWTCQTVWGVHHTVYQIPFVPELTPVNFLYAVLAGAAFGGAARLFSRSLHVLSVAAKSRIASPLWRPAAGGMLFALVVYATGTYEFIGLGIPGILDAFAHIQAPWAFALKILFTAFTLAVGFKGGEVTPLFFIGATLGSALSALLPLPTALLAGMGFIGVFAGAANTPFACLFMGIELFGSSGAAYLAIACIVAYLVSGHSGIYGSQRIGTAKTPLWARSQGRKLQE